MYSGTTLTSYSGRVLGTHQKIDRVARRHLMRLQPSCSFPSIRKILHFEGGNGPDGVKRKSPGKDEPWHYIQPFDGSDTQLLDIIEDHYKHLVQALKAHDEVRAAFEAAWLSHAIVDGLTPAHHFPYEEKLTELRGGAGKETRTTFKTKVVIPGDTPSHQVHNNWKMWGPKGLFTTHWTFEWGVSTLITPMRLKRAFPTKKTTALFAELGIREAFLLTAQQIAKQGYYERFHATGWTVDLARDIQKELLPVVVKTVTIAWSLAVREARMEVA